MSSLTETAVCKNLITKNAEVQTDLTISGELKCKTITCSSGVQTLKTAQADSFFLTTGALDINGLATSNPGIGGRVWNDAGTLKIV